MVIDMSCVKSTARAEKQEQSTLGTCYRWLLGNASILVSKTAQSCGFSSYPSICKSYINKSNNDNKLSCCFLFQVLKIPGKVLFFCALAAFGANKYFTTLEQWGSLSISWQDDRSCQTVIYFTRNDGCVDTWL